MIREQYFMLLIDEEAALAAIPGLLPRGMRGAPRRVRHAARGAGGARGSDRRRRRAA